MSFSIFSGANWMKRKVAMQFSPKLEIKIDGDRIQIHTSTMFWTQDDDLTIGQPIEKKMPQGDIEMRVRGLVKQSVTGL